MFSNEFPLEFKANEMLVVLLEIALALREIGLSPVTLLAATSMLPLINKHLAATYMCRR